MGEREREEDGQAASDEAASESVADVAGVAVEGEDDVETAADDQPAAEERAPADSEHDGDSKPLGESGPSLDGEAAGYSEPAPQTEPAGEMVSEAASDGTALAVEDAAAPLVGSAELKAIVEALIFASPEPLSLSAIAKLLDGETKEDVNAAIAALRTDYERPGGLQLVEVAGGFQIVTRPDLNDWVRRLFHERSTQKLSVQALETLAVIAYRQPITAAEVTEIRGVNTSGVLNTLLERHLVKIVGRKAVVGRPFMYATTKEFLIRFGLNDITDLPKVQDMVDALGLESPLLVERMTAEEQLPLEEPDTESAPGDASRG